MKDNKRTVLILINITEPIYLKSLKTTRKRHTYLMSHNIYYDKLLGFL